MAHTNLATSPGQLLTSAMVNELLQVDSNERVGIGTSSPVKKLQIHSTTTYDGILVEGNAVPNIGFSRATTVPEWKVGVSANNGANFSISTGATTADKLTIDTSGNVGIGTTSPSGAKLHIDQTGTSDRGMRVDMTPSGASTANAVWITAMNGDMNGTVVRIHHESPDADQKLLSLDVTGSNTEVFWVDEDGDGYFKGNVGIGTTSPEKVLDVIAGTVGNSWADIQIKNNGVASGTHGAGILFSGNQISSTTTQAFAAIRGNHTGNAAGTFSGEVEVYTSTGGTLTKQVTFEENGDVVVHNGNVFIGDTANTNMTQGLTINQGASDNEILAFKSSDVVQGMTNFAEADTYGSVAKDVATAGGLVLNGFTSSDPNTSAFTIRGFATTEDVSDSASSHACVEVRSSLKSGTSANVHGATGNIFRVANATTGRFLIKGNGDLHATNTTITALDTHDDIALARNLQKATSSDLKHEVSQEDYQKLIDVKALSSEGDFQIMQGMNAVSLGAISQLWNAIKSIAVNKLGMSEEELLAMTKQY